LETDPSTAQLTLFQLDAGFGLKIDDPKGESFVFLQSGFADRSLGLTSLFDSSLDTSSRSPFRKIGITEIDFFNKVLSGQVPAGTRLSPKDLAELDDILGKFNYLTTHDELQVQFAVSLRSEIDDLLLGKPQLATELGKLLSKSPPLDIESVKPLEFLVRDAPS